MVCTAIPSRIRCGNDYHSTTQTPFQNPAEQVLAACFGPGHSAKPLHAETSGRSFELFLDALKELIRNDPQSGDLLLLPFGLRKIILDQLPGLRVATLLCAAPCCLPHIPLVLQHLLDCALTPEGFAPRP